MKKPTPGPWKTGREDMQSYTGDGEAAFTNIYHATLTDGVHLGEPLPLTIGRAEGDNNKANARLIAAAPDLLEACKAVDKLWDCDSINFAAEMSISSPVGKVWALIRAAITKATEGKCVT